MIYIENMSGLYLIQYKLLIRLMCGIIDTHTAYYRVIVIVMRSKFV